jgi:hypothetical protein
MAAVGVTAGTAKKGRFGPGTLEHRMLTRMADRNRALS